MNGLRHKPLEGIMDTRAQGTDDAESQIIWRLHRQRMRSEISNLRVGMPHPALTHFDPYGLRVAATLLFIIGLAAAGSYATTRLYGNGAETPYRSQRKPKRICRSTKLQPIIGPNIRRDRHPTAPPSKRNDLATAA